MVVPSEPGTLVDPTSGVQAVQQALRRLSKRLLPGWQGLTEASIVLTVLSGGITNQLWKVFPPEGTTSLQPAVVRVFGEDTEKFIDRAAEEHNLLELNRFGFGAKVLATFGNGRFEELLVMRTLEPEDMCEAAISVRIARRLRQFHACDIPGPREPQVFAMLRRWFEAARVLDFSGHRHHAEMQRFDFNAMSRELDVAEQACLRLGSPVVFGHNDLLAGNVLVTEGPESTRVPHGVQFIDFEYSCWSFRGFDFGNHFNERAGFYGAYDRYPSRTEAAAFIHAYLSEGAAEPPDEALVDRLVTEANTFALVSHQFWGTFAILQAKFSSVDFDYAAYAHVKWGEYYKRKDEFLAAAASLACEPSRRQAWAV